MKRLIKKARHDTLNREFAIIYANGKFYEDITHAACCKQVFKDFNFENIKLKSNILRPDFSTFEKNFGEEYNNAGTRKRNHGDLLYFQENC